MSLHAFVEYKPLCPQILILWWRDNLSLNPAAFTQIQLVRVDNVCRFNAIISMFKRVGFVVLKGCILQHNYVSMVSLDLVEQARALRDPGIVSAESLEHSTSPTPASALYSKALDGVLMCSTAF